MLCQCADGEGRSRRRIHAPQHALQGPRLLHWIERLPLEILDQANILHLVVRIGHNTARDSLDPLDPLCCSPPSLTVGELEIAILMGVRANQQDGNKPVLPNGDCQLLQIIIAKFPPRLVGIRANPIQGEILEGDPLGRCQVLPNGLFNVLGDLLIHRRLVASALGSRSLRDRREKLLLLPCFSHSQPPLPEGHPGQSYQRPQRFYPRILLPISLQIPTPVSGLRVSRRRYRYIPEQTCSLAYTDKWRAVAHGPLGKLRSLAPRHQRNARTGQMIGAQTPSHSGEGPSERESV